MINKATYTLKLKKIAFGNRAFDWFQEAIAWTENIKQSIGLKLQSIGESSNRLVKAGNQLVSKAIA